MPNIGAPELAIILVIVLVIFGPKRLPGLGKQLGTGMREFKDSITGDHKDRDDDEDKPALTAATGQTDTAAASQPAGRPEPEHKPAETAPEPRS